MPGTDQKASVSAQTSVQKQVRDIPYNMMDSSSRCKRKMSSFFFQVQPIQLCSYSSISTKELLRDTKENKNEYLCNWKG